MTSTPTAIGTCSLLLVLGGTLAVVIAGPLVRETASVNACGAPLEGAWVYLAGSFLVLVGVVGGFVAPLGPWHVRQRSRLPAILALILTPVALTVILTVGIVNGYTPSDCGASASLG